MADYPLTDAQIMQLAYRVRGLIRSESKTVSEVPIIDSLEGIVSMPVIQTVGGVSRYVRATVSLLSQPARDALVEHLEELQAAIGKVEAATRNAEAATQDTQKATGDCRTEIEKCKEVVASALEVLSHPPVVDEDGFLSVYDYEQRVYVKTDVATLQSVKEYVRLRETIIQNTIDQVANNLTTSRAETDQAIGEVAVSLAEANETIDQVSANLTSTRTEMDRAIGQVANDLAQHKTQANETIEQVRESCIRRTERLVLSGGTPADLENNT